MWRMLKYVLDKKSFETINKLAIQFRVSGYQVVQRRMDFLLFEPHALDKT